jgi:uncharacterized protein (TIGR00369 family)
MKKMFEKWQSFWESASDEEKKIMEIFLEGIFRKHERKNGSYIGGILHANGTFIEEKEIYKITMPNTPLIQNSLGIVHGGITATILDSAMGSLVNHLLPNDQAAVTTEMKINYTAPGKGESFTCIASIIHKGTKIFVTEGKVFQNDGKLIAHGTGSFFIIPRHK